MYIAVFLCREEGSNTSAKWSESPSKGSSLQRIKRLRIVLNDAQLNVSNVKMIIETESKNLGCHRIICKNRHLD